MANPLLVQAGATVAGGLLNRAFNSAPDAPDLQSPVREEFDMQARFLEQAQKRRRERMGDRMRASGTQGSGAVGPTERMASQSAQENQRVATRRASSLAQARNQEAQMQNQLDQQRHQATAQGIGTMVSGVGQHFSNKAMMDQLREQMGEGEGDDAEGMGVQDIIQQGGSLRMPSPKPAQIERSGSPAPEGFDNPIMNFLG